jgi:hypothetical protein
MMSRFGPCPWCGSPEVCALQFGMLPREGYKDLPSDVRNVGCVVTAENRECATCRRRWEGPNDG